MATIDPAFPYDPDVELLGGGKTICEMLSRLIVVQAVDHYPTQGCYYGQPTKDFDFFEGIKNFDVVRREIENAPIVPVIKFSHSSVRTYLLQDRNDTIPHDKFRFSVNMANSLISKSCLAIVKFFSSEDGPKPVSNTLSYIIYEYIPRHWHHHAATLPNEEPGSLFHIFNNDPSVVKTLTQVQARSMVDSLDFLEILDEDYDQQELLLPETQLIFAAYCGCDHMIIGILDQYPHVDINAGVIDNSGNFLDNALSIACKTDHWQTVGLLLDRGADPNVHSDDEAPILVAASKGPADIVRKLIAHNADIDFEGGLDFLGGVTPLTTAMEADRLDIMTLLLSSGAPPDWGCDRTTMPPKNTAAEYGKVQHLELLLKYGATLQPTPYEPSLLELASKSGSLQKVEFLLGLGLDPNDMTYKKPHDGYRVASDSHYYLGVNGYPNATIDRFFNHYYGSPLHVAAANGYIEIMELLLKHGAAVDEKSYYWGTPATIAKLRGKEAALDVLAFNGATTVDLPNVYYNQDRFQPHPSNDGSCCLREGLWIRSSRSLSCSDPSGDSEVDCDSS